MNHIQSWKSGGKIYLNYIKLNKEFESLVKNVIKFAQNKMKLSKNKKIIYLEQLGRRFVQKYA